jgi:hypothetical protein
MVAWLRSVAVSDLPRTRGIERLHIRSFNADLPRPLRQRDLAAQEIAHAVKMRRSSGMLEAISPR